MSGQRKAEAPGAKSEVQPGAAEASAPSAEGKRRADDLEEIIRTVEALIDAASGKNAEAFTGRDRAALAATKDRLRFNIERLAERAGSTGSVRDVLALVVEDCLFAGSTLLPTAPVHRGLNLARGRAVNAARTAKAAPRIARYGEWIDAYRQANPRANLGRGEQSAINVLRWVKETPGVLRPGERLPSPKTFLRYLPTGREIGENSV